MDETVSKQMREPNDSCANHTHKANSFINIEREHNISCSTCVFYDHGTCRKSGFDTQLGHACSDYQTITKQEVKQMKDYIVEKHEVKLDGTWYAVDPIVNTDGKIMFTDPRSATIPQPAAPYAPTPGAFKVTHLMISKNDDYYRTSRVMRVVLNKNMQIVTSFDDSAEVIPSLNTNEQYATVILD